jgi:hypothetical protein
MGRKSGRGKDTVGACRRVGLMKENSETGSNTRKGEREQRQVYGGRSDGYRKGDREQRHRLHGGRRDGQRKGDREQRHGRRRDGHRKGDGDRGIF